MQVIVLVMVVLSLTLAPLGVGAQQMGKVWRIGVLGGSPPTTPEATRPWEALLLGLRELGYNEGQNIVIERRWAGGRAERYHELAAELVAWKPDVIVAAFTPSVNAAKRAIQSEPVSWRASNAPAGTSPACRFRTVLSWLGSGCKSSRKPFPM